VIYYYFTKGEQIYMLYAYPKSKKVDFTADQLKQLFEEQLSINDEMFNELLESVKQAGDIQKG